MRFNHRSLLPLALAGALLYGAPAGAGQATTSFDVTATVGGACTLQAAGGLAFGVYTGSTVNGQTQLSLSCSQPVNGLIGFIGQATTGGFQMSGGNGNSLDYNLYFDASHGNQIVAGQLYDQSASAGGATTTVDIFGEIPSGQSPSDGSYADTVLVLFEF